MVETMLLTLASQSAVAAGTTSALATAGGVATAGSVAFSAPVLMSAGGTLLSGGLMASSALGSIMGGQQNAAAYKAQAVQYELSAKQEELKGRDQADKIRRSLQATLASQNAAFASRGISLGSGTPVNLANVSKNEASRDIQLAQFGSGMSAAAQRGQAAQSKISASAAKIEGYTSAAKSLGSLL